jgi:FMN-dependent oxidoreductase (nitrilotriacetate monooxygenase family)
MTMSKQMRLNTFSMNCVGHQAQGLWRHPRDRSVLYTSIDHWVELARTLERGCFDALFLADVLGVYDVYAGGPDAALRNAAQVPANDPMLVVPVMAAVTEHLGFGVTGITSFEPPYTFARRMSTLDHLTDGRMSWNIVTGYLDSAARAMGEIGQTPHDTRYEMAEEYLEVVYRLWEGSWEDGAVVRNRATGTYADPAKVHRITHQGRYYRVDGIHLAEPSPQRTPVLFQAGSSRLGQRFAARHAECVFVAGTDRTAAASAVSQLRREIAAAGRDPAGVLVYSMISIVVDETPAAARHKAEDYASYASPEGALALLSGWSGKDYARPLDEQPAGDAIEGAARSSPRDVEAAARHVALAGPCPLVVGSPTEVADELEAWMTATGVDGFNVTRQVLPETYVDVVDMLVPELQRRGVYRREYAPGTLREKLTGGAARLSPPHPAAGYRPSPAERG